MPFCCLVIDTLGPRSKHISLCTAHKCHQIHGHPDIVHKHLTMGSGMFCLTVPFGHFPARSPGASYLTSLFLSPPL